MREVIAGVRHSVCKSCKQPFFDLTRDIQSMSGFGETCSYCDGQLEETNYVIASALVKLQKQNEIYKKALDEIINPIECPACNTDNPASYVPCYCYEEWNTSFYRARKALADAEAVE